MLISLSQSLSTIIGVTNCDKLMTAIEVTVLYNTLYIAKWFSCNQNWVVFSWQAFCRLYSLYSYSKVRVYRSAAGVNLSHWLVLLMWLKPNQVLITQMRLTHPKSLATHLERSKMLTLLDSDLTHMCISTHMISPQSHHASRPGFHCLISKKKKCLKQIPHPCFSNASPKCHVYFLTSCAIFIVNHCEYEREWPNYNCYWTLPSLETAGWITQALDTATKKEEKGETETLWKKEVCFWFQVAVKNVPCVLSVLAMDLPAFNTWVDKKLFIWILSAKKLPRLA